MSTDLHPAALAIANWWADHSGMVTGTGEGGRNEGDTVALAVIAGAQGRRIEPDKREAFVTALARRVTAQMERFADNPHWSVTIGVDYGADPILSESAAEVGARPNFPWKTMTWTYPDHVAASLGYHGPTRLVWAAEGWEHPTCGTGQYSDGPDWKRLPWKCSGLRYHEEPHTFDAPEPLCGVVIDVNGRSEECNRPDGHEWHRPVDGYSSRMLHDFATAEVTAG